MDIDTKQLRFCLSIDCKELKDRECGAKECIHPNKKVAVEERLRELQEVKHGGQ